MSILYDFYNSPISNEKAATHTPTYHARVVGGQTLDPQILINRISQRSTLGKGDILSLFKELSDELAQELLAGNRVSIPGIGYFSLSLHAPREAQPNATRAQHIRVKGIEFRAEASLRNRVQSHALFERSREKVHSAKLTHEEINDLLTEYFNGHPYLTCRSFCELCHFTKGTAQNHLKRLLQEGRLVNTNTPRNPIYMLGDYTSRNLHQTSLSR